MPPTVRASLFQVIIKHLLSSYGYVDDIQLCLQIPVLRKLASKHDII